MNEFSVLLFIGLEEFETGSVDVKITCRDFVIFDCKESFTEQVGNRVKEVGRSLNYMRLGKKF